MYFFKRSNSEKLLKNNSGNFLLLKRSSQTKIKLIKNLTSLTKQNQIDSKRTDICLQNCTDLERRNDDKSLENSGAEAREDAAMVADLAGLGILEGALEDGVGAHAKRVLQGQVSRERGKPLPEGPHALGSRDGRAAVDNSSVGPTPIELQPRLDHVDGLQTARLHDSAQRPRHSFHVRRDRLLGSSAIVEPIFFVHRHG